MATTITSKVLDAAGKPIPFANVTLVDLDGNTIKVLQSANANGNFSVPSNAVPFWDDTFVEVSAVGYKSESYIPEDLPATLNLEEDVKSISGLIIKSVKKKVKKANYALPIVLGAAGLASIGVFFYKKFA